jgi:hypothetical protein
MATLADLTVPEIKRTLKVLGVTDAEILGCPTRQQLLALAWSRDIVGVPDQWTLEESKAKQQREREQARQISGAAGMELVSFRGAFMGKLQEGGGGKASASAGWFEWASSGGDEGSRAGRQASRSAPRESPARVRRAESTRLGASPTGSPQTSTRPSFVPFGSSRRQQPPPRAMSPSTQAWMERAAEEVAESRRAEAERRKAVQRAARKMASRAAESPLPTNYPNYPDHARVPPHIKQRNERMREENRMEVERVEAVRQQYLMESAATSERAMQSRGRNEATREDLARMRPKSVRAQGVGVAGARRPRSKRVEAAQSARGSQSVGGFSFW